MKLRKTFCMILAMILMLAAVPAAFAGNILGENEELEVNEGRIEENWGTIKSNTGSGLTPDADGKGIVTNYWRVNDNKGAIRVNYGEMVDPSADLYSAAEVYNNGGTVFTNLGVIYTNSADVAYNAFLVMNNTTGAVVTDNLGNLAEVNINSGRIINNGESAAVDINDYTGVVENNASFVGVNYGTVCNVEGGKIDYNFGKMIQNGEVFYGIGLRENEEVTVFDLPERKVNSGFREGEMVPLPDETFYARPGSVFAGWKCSADGKIYEAGSLYRMTDTPALFTAQWKNNSASM